MPEQLPSPTLPPELERALLGAEVTLDRDQVAELAGVPEPVGRAIWLALGFAEVPAGEVAFTTRDADALRRGLALREAGVLDDATLLVMARATGQALARLAEAHVGVMRRQARELSPEDARAEVLARAGSVLDELEPLVVHVWRRQFAAASLRAFAALETEGTPEVAVGFVDLVGFTRTTRALSADELEELVETFERDTSLRVATHGGRVVKTLGDAVLFVCDDTRAAVEVALETLAAHAHDERLSEARAGIARGPVLARLGDVYGEPVNLASRLTDEARPSTLLVDGRVAEEIEADPAYVVQRLGRRPVRGYRALQPYRVRHTSAPGSDS